MNTQAWLSRLIAFDTTSRNSNLELIADIESWLATQQMTSRLIRDPHEPKANLFATLPASNGDTHGGLIFSGHTDVVPVDGQAWDTDPFVATVIDDKIFGRGTCDMKGFIAVVLALAPTFREMRLPYPIHFAFSYDEEIGCRGAPFLIEELQKLQIKPKACIVGEPTDMRLVIAHKGIQVFRAQMTGIAAHSSLTPKGCNAIEYAAQLINFIRKLADEIKQQGPFDPHFDVPFTSVSTNMIHGGIAHNTIPALCEFQFEFRHLPNVTPNSIIDKINHYIKNELLPVMQRENPQSNITITNIAAAPSFESGANDSIQHLTRDICQESHANKVAYATEAGLFQNALIPSVVCGPGNIEQAHRANEYVSLAQLQQCEVFLSKLVKRFAEH